MISTGRRPGLLPARSDPNPKLPFSTRLSGTLTLLAGQISGAQLCAIKERQGLELLEPERDEPIHEGALQRRNPFPLPSVSLIEIRPVP